MVVFQFLFSALGRQDGGYRLPRAARIMPVPKTDFSQFPRPTPEPGGASAFAGQEDLPVAKVAAVGVIPARHGTAQSDGSATP
jgi:hypothetical protein